MLLVPGEAPTATCRALAHVSCLDQPRGSKETRRDRVAFRGHLQDISGTERHGGLFRNGGPKRLDGSTQTTRPRADPGDAALGTGADSLPLRDVEMPGYLGDTDEV